MSGPLRAARTAFARLIPRPDPLPDVQPEDPDEAAARNAFLAPGSLQPAAPLGRHPVPKADVALETASVETLRAEPGRAPEPHAVEAPASLDPGERTGSRRDGAADRSETSGGTLAWPTLTSTPDDLVVALEEPAAPMGRKAPANSLGSLLEPPTSVVRVSDDFFEGLIRQVERDR